MSNYIRVSVDLPSYQFQMHSSALRLGIIGAGRLGAFHAEKAFRHPEVELHGVFDSCDENRKQLAGKYDIEQYEQLPELLSRVDAVVIATPTVSHHRIGMDCIESGVHVLMEKPLARSYADAKELVQYAEEKNLILQVGHVEQFNPGWSSASSILESLREGERAIITARRSSGYTFRSTDIGVVHDLMVHDLDLILSVVDSEVQSLHATGFHVLGTREQGGCEDIAHARLTFENGSVAELRASRVDQQASRKMRIQTASQSVEIDFASRETQIVRATESVVRGQYSPGVLGNSCSSEMVKNFMNEQFQTIRIEQDPVDALSLEMEDFVQSIRERREPQVSGRRALRSVEIADAIVRAIAQNDILRHQQAKAA